MMKIISFLSAINQINCCELLWWREREREAHKES